jgi:lipopolysaccharide transport system permease protein
LLRELWLYRDFTLSLMRRQYLLRYRQSLVGLAWAILPPFATLAAATLVFHRVARIDTGAVSYPLFALSGLAPWSFFASSITFAVPAVVQNSQMVTRLPFPRAVLPLSMIGTALIDLAVSTGAFVVFAYVTGAGLPVTALWFPILLLLEMVLAVGVVLFGSALNVFARDVRLAIPLIVQLWLFLTPVMYPLESVPAGLRHWFLFNPMTGLIDGFRRILVHNQAPDLGLLAPAIAGAVVFLALGSWYFWATERRFADVV